VVLLFWLSLALLGLLAARNLHKGAGMARSLTMLAACIWLGLAVLPEHFETISRFQNFILKVRRANTALLVGVTSRAEYAPLLSAREKGLKRNSLDIYGPLLRRKQLGIFAEGHHELLGLTRGDYFQNRDPVQCPGELRIAKALGQGQRQVLSVKGSLSGESASRVPGLFLLTDPQDRIVGLARPLLQPIDPFGWRIPKEISWAGYAHANPDAELGVWAVTAEREVCAVTLPVRSMLSGS
jgi:hypothetical protein